MLKYSTLLKLYNLNLQLMLYVDSNARYFMLYRMKDALDSVKDIDMVLY